MNETTKKSKPTAKPLSEKRRGALKLFIEQNRTTCADEDFWIEFDEKTDVQFSINDDE